jgi:hypothetical protein
MFIKITRLSDSDEKMELIIPVSRIASVCSGYERGSRVLLAERRDEIAAEETVGEIWQMMKEMK